MKGKLNDSLKELLRNKGYIIVNDYNLALLNNHALDFTDLIVKTKQLFNIPEVVSSIKRKYKYINIDEVQDTSTIEYSIIEMLFK